MILLLSDVHTSNLLKRQLSGTVVYTPTPPPVYPEEEQSLSLLPRASIGGIAT